EYLVVRDPVKLSNQKPPINSTPPMEQISRLRNIAQDVLTVEELEIVWLKMQYYDRETGESRVPQVDLEEICQRHGITKDAFRKKYQRALGKVEEAICVAKTNF